MDNMFGLGVVIEVEDKATDSLNSVSRALDRTESEARGLSSAINNVSNSISNVGGVDDTTRSFNNLSNQLGGVQNSSSSCRSELEGLAGSMDRTSHSADNLNQSVRGVNLDGATSSVRRHSNAVEGLSREYSSCSREARNFQSSVRGIRGSIYDTDSILNNSNQSFSQMIKTMSDYYGGYSEHSRRARKMQQLMFKQIQLNTKSANELAQGMQGVAQSNLNMWKQTEGGKEVAKIFQNLNNDIKEARLAVVGFNSERVAISAEESNATMQKFRGTVDSTKASLDKMLKEGTISTGLYQTALMQLANEQRHVEVLHSRGFRTVQHYNQELLRLGITTTSQADLQALALERNRWAIEGMTKSILQRTNSASKYSKVLKEQQSLFGSLSEKTLGWMDSLQQLAKQGDPTVMTAKLQALGMSGKEVSDTMMSVAGEVMGFGQVMMGLVPIVALFYGTLFGMARQQLPWLDKKLSQVGETWGKVFEPLVALFGKVAGVFLDVANAVGNFVLKIRDAHPIVAKLLDVFTMLFPAVMLLVGAFGLMKLAQAQLFSQMMMLVADALNYLAKITPMALLITGAISILSVGLMHLWKTNKEFRNGVINLWEDIKSKVSDVCKIISKHWETLKTSLGVVGQAMFGLLKSIFEIGFTIIGAIFGKGTEDFKKVWNLSWTDILNKTNEVLGNITTWVAEKLNALATFIQSVTVKIKEWWKQHGDEVIKVALQAYETVKEHIKSSLTFISEVVSSVLDVIASYWSQNKDKIVPIVSALVSAIGSLLGSMRDVVKSILDVVLKFWEDHGTQIMETVTTIFSVITDIISSIAPVIEGVLNGISSFVQKHGDTISTIFSVAWTLISGFVIGILNNIKGVIEGTLNAIGGIIDFFSALFQGDFRGMWEAIKQIFKGAVETIYNGAMLWFNVQFLGSLKGLVSGGVGLVRGLWEGIKNLWSNGVTACYVWIDDLVKAVIGFFTNLPSNCAGLVTNLWNVIKNLFKTGCQWVGSIVQTFKNQIINFFTGLSTGSTTIMRGLWNLAKGIWSTGVGALKSLISGMVNTVKSLLSGMVSSATSFFRNLFSAGKAQFSNLVNAVRSSMSQVPSTIRNFMSNAISYLRNISLVSIGKNMIQGLINGIKSMASSVAGAIKSVADGAVKKAKQVLGIHSPSRVFKQIGAWSSEGMAIGVEDNAPLVSQSVENTSIDAVGVAKREMEQLDAVQIVKDVNVNNSLGKKALAPQTHSNVTNHNTFEIKIEGGEHKNPRQLAQDIYEEIKRLQQLDNILSYQ